MTTFFWSDTHFNHEGIAYHCPHTRPFKTVDTMNEWLVDLWNSKVRPKDRIFLLGDFAFRHPDGWALDRIFNSLNGEMHLVRGNHDHQNKDVFKLPWASQHDLVTVKENGMRAVCCHYPLETWDRAYKDRLMFYGHSHGTLKRQIPRRFDVGVDAEGFMGPLPFEELYERAMQQTFEPADHHGD